MYWKEFSLTRNQNCPCDLHEKVQKLPASEKGLLHVLYIHLPARAHENDLKIRSMKQNDTNPHKIYDNLLFLRSVFLSTIKEMFHTLDIFG